MGQLRFPDLYQIGGSTLLEAGASITLVWQNPPPEAVHYDFFFYPFGESESRVMLGSDTSDRDGVGIPWSIPKGLKGSLQAAAFFPDGEVVFSEKVRNVYSGNVPFWNTPVPGTMYGQADQVPYIGETTLVDCRQDLAQEDPQTYQEWHDRLLVLYPELSVVEPGASCRLSDDTVIVTFSHSNANGLSSGQTIARFSTSGEVVSSARWAFCSSAGTRSYPVIQKLEAGNLVLSCFGEQSNAQDTVLMDLDSLTIILQEPVS